MLLLAACSDDSPAGDALTKAAGVSTTADLGPQLDTEGKADVAGADAGVEGDTIGSDGAAAADASLPMDVAAPLDTAASEDTEQPLDVVPAADAGSPADIAPADTALATDTLVMDVQQPPDAAADATLSDTALPDTALPDTAVDPPDSSSPDTASQDIAAPDAGPKDTGPPFAPKPGPADLKFDFSKFKTVLPAGQEDIICWYLPPDGKEHWLVAVDASFQHDVHHLRVDRILDTIGKKAFGPKSCIQGTSQSPYEPGWTTTGELPGSQEAVLQVQFPPGHGFRIGPKHGLYFELHVLNTTTKPKEIKGYYHIFTAEKAKVTDPVGLFLHFNQKCNYPPGIYTQGVNCKATKDIQMLFGMGHMHFFGTELTVKVNGQLMYKTTATEDVLVKQWPLPGFAIKKGDVIRTSCTYDNKLKQNLTTGYSDIYNAMCGFVGFYTPTTDSESLICWN